MAAPPAVSSVSTTRSPAPRPVSARVGAVAGDYPKRERPRSKDAGDQPLAILSADVREQSQMTSVARVEKGHHLEQAVTVGVAEAGFDHLPLLPAVIDDRAVGDGEAAGRLFEEDAFAGAVAVEVDDDGGAGSENVSGAARDYRGLRAARQEGGYNEDDRKEGGYAEQSAAPTRRPAKPAAGKAEGARAGTGVVRPYPAACRAR